MQLIQLVFALLSAAQPAPAEVYAAMPAVQQEQQIAVSAPLADWEQVLFIELADSPQYAGELAAAIKAAASETEIPPEVLWSVAFTESHGRHWNEAGRVKRGGAGEVGLMQIKPFWTKALKREYGLDVDLWKPADNVRAGAYILSRGGENLHVMLSYYNTGKQLRGSRYQRKVCSYLSRLDELADESLLPGEQLLVAGLEPEMVKADAEVKPQPAAARVRTNDTNAPESFHDELNAVSWAE